MHIKVVEAQQDLQHVWCILQTYSEIDRAAFVLRVHHELSYAEIARVLGQIRRVARAKRPGHRPRRSSSPTVVFVSGTGSVLGRAALTITRGMISGLGAGGAVMGRVSISSCPTSYYTTATGLIQLCDDVGPLMGNQRGVSPR